MRYYASRGGKFSRICFRDNSVRSAGNWSAAPLWHSALRQNREHRWQFYAKHRAARLAVVAKNLAPMFLHNAIADA
jgi:hypothetical protein